MKKSFGWLVVLGFSVFTAAAPAWSQEADPKPSEPAIGIAEAEVDPTPTKSAAGGNKAKVGTGERPALQPLTVTLDLSNGKVLSGTLLEVADWQMKTSFGAASLPLSTVAGIKFAQEGNATTTVVLHNGDTITGALEIERVEIETEWGKAIVNAPHIASLMFTPGLKWTSEKGLSGVRWRLTEVEKTPSGTTASGGSPGVAPASFNGPPRVPGSTSPMRPPFPR